MSDLLGEVIYKQSQIEALHRKIERLEAELADLRASSVVVRERCPSCDGTGCVHDDPIDIRRSAGLHDPCCPDCVDGWRLAEGVRQMRWCDTHAAPFDTWLNDPDPDMCAMAHLWEYGGIDHGPTCRETTSLVIPARLIEGDPE